MPLSQAQVDRLRDGTRVLVRWSGGNGPFKYVVRVRDGVRWAYTPEENIAVAVLSLCGDRPLTEVELA